MDAYGISFYYGALWFHKLLNPAASRESLKRKQILLANGHLCGHPNLILKELKANQYHITEVRIERFNKLSKKMIRLWLASVMKTASTIHVMWLCLAVKYYILLDKIVYNIELLIAWARINNPSTHYYSSLLLIQWWYHELHVVSLDRKILASC